MVEISRLSQSYTLLAPAAVNASFKVLRDLGSNANPTRTDLRQQSNDLRQFANNLIGLTQVSSQFELTRSLKNAEDVSRNISVAVQAASDRFAGVAALNNQREDRNLKNAKSTGTGSAIVALLQGYGAENENDVIATLASALTRSSTARKSAPLTVRATDTTGPKYGEDIFERGIQPSLGAGGGATLDINRRALSATVYDEPLNLGNFDKETLRVVRAAEGGAYQPDNDGFSVKGRTGAAAATAIYDTRDGSNEDNRSTTIDHRFGGASDVLFVAGQNDTYADGGAGDDVLVAEGNSTLRGGEGNDLVAGRYAFGDAGDDLVFSSGVGVGGDGDDIVVLFAIESDDAPSRLVGLGGAGNDELLAQDKAILDGGEGDDRIVLRAGGEAYGGNGDDVITAFGAAVVDGGAGDDDILVGLGIDAKDDARVVVTAGDGADKVQAEAFADVSLGKGNDTAVLNYGGIVRFARGDGIDTVTLSADRPAGATGAPKVNTAVFANLMPADVTITILGFDVSIAINGSTDRLSIRLDAIDKPLDLRFEKNGQSQTIRVENTIQTTGPLVPIPPGT